MSSLVGKKEEQEQEQQVDGLFALGINVQCIDLTWTYDQDTIFWPGGTEKFSLCMNCVETDSSFYSAGSFTTAEHGGTHVDAPYHFAKHGKTIEQLRLKDLIAPCFVIDVRSKCYPRDPHGVNYLITPQDIVTFEQTHQVMLTPGSIVLFLTGWSSFWKKGAKQYLGFDETTEEQPYDPATSVLAFPGLGTEAATLLVERRVAGVGVDTASIDAGSSKDFIVHKVLLSNGIYGIENINNQLEQLPASGSTLFVMPMKIGGGSGAPARVCALIP